MDPSVTGATMYLGPSKGEELHSGLMLWQVTATALVSEMKTLAHPASIDSIPTSLGQEDHVSMSMWAADKLWQIVECWRTVIALEAVAAVRAAHLSHRFPRRGPLLHLARRIRELDPPPFEDHLLGSAVQAVETQLERADRRTKP